MYSFKGPTDVINKVKHAKKRNLYNLKTLKTVVDVVVTRNLRALQSPRYFFTHI